MGLLLSACCQAFEPAPIAITAIKAVTDLAGVWTGVVCGICWGVQGRWLVQQRQHHWGCCGERVCGRGCEGAIGQLPILCIPCIPDRLVDWHHCWSGSFLPAVDIGPSPASSTS